MADDSLIDELLEDAAERMVKSVESAHHEFSTVRTGRASPSLLDRVLVDYYGASTPLNQLATISVPEARLITVQPYDKSSIKAIEKAINESDVGLNPSNDGNVIRLVVPELTEERRRELVKVVRNLAEEGRVAVRNVRRDQLGLGPLAPGLEQRHRARRVLIDRLGQGIDVADVGCGSGHAGNLMALTDGRIGDLDGALKAKEEEILAV